LESENNWKTKECGYLYDKIKNLESILEKAKYKEINEKYDINNKPDKININQNKYSISDYNDLDKTVKSQQSHINLKENSDYTCNGNSKVIFEDGIKREECTCNCSIY